MCKWKVQCDQANCAHNSGNGVERALDQNHFASLEIEKGGTHEAALARVWERAMAPMDRKRATDIWWNRNMMRRKVKNRPGSGESPETYKHTSSCKPAFTHRLTENKLTRTISIHMPWMESQEHCKLFGLPVMRFVAARDESSR